MPFNGSGTFVPLAAPTFPAVSGTLIEATKFNNNMLDIFNEGLSKCITRSGESPATGNLPMAGFRHTGAGDPVGVSDYATWGKTVGLRGSIGASDWDGFITTGAYEATSASLTAPSTNFPSTSEVGQLMVITQGAVTVQFYVTKLSIWTRTKSGSTWTTWVQAASTAFIIGTDVQAWDVVLDSLSALAGGADKLPYFTSTTALSQTDLTTFGRSLIDDADAATARATLALGGLATLSTVDTAQITDDAVTYAKIQNVSATDKLLGRSTAGAGNVEEIVCTAAGRALLDDASASAQRTTLGLAIGTNVQAWDADLDAVAALATTGLVARTGAATYSPRTLTGPAAGIDITNGNGVAGNPTLALADDLAALEGMTGIGMAARTAADTWIERTITGTANKVTVNNGDGAAGNPTITLPDAITLVTPTVTGAINLTGGQIAFPATAIPSGDANTLDDYEVGTWTVVLTFQTPGNLNVVYSTQVGRYVKIGDFVWLEFSVITSTFTHTTASGDVRLTGVPFAASGTNNDGQISSMTFQGITKANYTQFGMLASSTALFGRASGSGQSQTTITAADMPTGGTVRLSGQVSFSV